MKPKRTITALIVSIACAPLLGAAIPLVAPAPTNVLPASFDAIPSSLRITPVPLAPENPPPRVSFSIPKYELSTLERRIVASCLVLEAASQGEFGMRGVMAVIYNRARGLPELFAPTVLREKQFSALNKLTAGRESLSRVVGRAERDRMWEAALRIVDEATTDRWRDPTGGATHYTRTGERTSWTRALAKTVTIGRHAFYR